MKTHIRENLIYFVISFRFTERKYKGSVKSIYQGSRARTIKVKANRLHIWILCEKYIKKVCFNNQYEMVWASMETLVCFNFLIKVSLEQKQ
jgi:hypothetical protein